MAAAEGGGATESGRGVEEDVLKEVVTSLRPFLAHLGLKPSRVVPYMRGPADQALQFPTRDMLRSLRQHEMRDETGQMAALSFVDMLLSQGAPPTVLSDFMVALFSANHDPSYHNPNQGAWRVHDVLQLSCAYLPLQHALQQQQQQATATRQEEQQQATATRQQGAADPRGDGRGPHLDVRGMVTRLSELRLLAPELCPLILDELDEPLTALTYLLTCVHATRVDMLMDEFQDWVDGLRTSDQDDTGGPLASGSPPRVPSGSGGGGGGGDDDGDSPPYWLRCVVEAIEDHGGEGFGRLLPASVFSTHTWSRVYDQLAYGRRGRIHDDEDTHSEGGDSGTTLLPDDDDENNDDDHHHHDDQRALPAERARVTRSKVEDYLRNMEISRTRYHVHGSGTDRGLEIPYIMEQFRYEFQKQDGGLDSSPALSMAGAPDPWDDDGVSMVSQSTETNSHVADLDDDGSSSSSSVRLCLMRDVSGSLRMSSEGQIKLREYQEELLHWTRQKCNVAIFLPTGTGKTFVMLRYMQEHLSEQGGVKRVVFLAPKVKLAEQQYHRFSEFFPHATYFRCGRYRSSNAPFSELLDTYKVYVMTPQCLVEALERKEVQLTDFSVLVLDECHHVARGKHSFRVLMEYYLNFKYSPESLHNNTALPQVIGLTASPGVGTLGTVDGAVKHIRQLCYVMNVERICTVKENTEQLKFYVNEPKHQIHTCGHRKKDGFKKIVEEMMRQTEQAMLQCVDQEKILTEERQQRLKTIVSGPTLHRGRPMYLHWASNLQDKVTDFTDCPHTYRALFSMTEMLVMCQRVLMLNEDSDSLYAMEFLQSHLSTLEDQVPRSHLSSQERHLLDLFNYQIPDLQAACEDPEDYNPKLRMLEEILLALMEKNPDDCSCMVFVRSLELTRAIQSWIKRHPQLKCLKPGRITGLKKSINDGGMQRQEISDVMTNFNIGEHRLVVCTSAAEEGLDFQACNLVVRYDYVTSMISMIQIRGRARRMDSQYCLLGSLSRANVTKEQENQAWERLMSDAIVKVQRDMELNPNSFLEAMAHWQRADCEGRRRQHQAAAEKERQRIQGSAVYRLLCRKCQRFVCKSTDFRMVCQSSRAVVAKDFSTRWKRVERGDGKQINQKLEKVAKVHCREPDCAYDWGILARYKPNGRLMPVLKIESFFLVDCATGEQLKHKFKWSTAPFHVPDISEEELAAA